MVGGRQGETIAIRLYKGFTDALASLKLPPAVTGTAELTRRFVVPPPETPSGCFKPGSVPNFVVGEIQHEDPACPDRGRHDGSTHHLQRRPRRHPPLTATWP